MPKASGPKKALTTSHRALAVWGTSSGAGKSLITTALARWYQRQGLEVMPFKAQNMSNHVAMIDGGEMGVAQWLQALAARQTPRVEMNPVLSKPRPDGTSQVVLLGQLSEKLTQLPWRERASQVWDTVRKTVDVLAEEADLLLVEGAGSPAEINLADVDLANLAIARHLNAPALLISDIDRGGAFAHIYGTWSLLPREHRARIRGFVMNGFRGDASLLAPGPQRLSQLTEVASVAVMPWLAHELPEEDSAGKQRKTPGENGATDLEATFELLADAVEEHLDLDLLRRFGGL